MKNCFIICPIGNENSETRKRSDYLLEFIVKPICEECRFEAIRIDNANNNLSITDDILTHLNKDELVIADLSELNPNVFYEIGYRSAIGKPIIHIKSKSEIIPFDIAHVRAYDYDITDLASVKDVKLRLVNTIRSMDFTQNETMEPSKSVSINSQILQELYKIQDEIEKLSEKITDSSAISVLADKLAQNNKSDQAIMMEAIMPELIKNPKAMLDLAELAKKLK